MLRLDLNRIYKEMNKRGWTKAELARQTGLSKQLIQYILENDSLKRVHKIAKAFDVDPKDLIK